MDRRLVIRSISLATALFAVAPPRLAPLAAQETPTRWYVVRVGSAPAGWMRETRTSTDSGIIVATAMHLAFNRLGSTVAMETNTRSLESPKGRFLDADVSMRLSDQVTEMSASVMNDSMRLRTRAGGREFTRMLPIVLMLSGPAAIDRLSAMSLRHPGDSVTYGAYDPTAAAPAIVTRVLASFDTAATSVGRRSLRRVIERSSASPVATTYWIDSVGAVIRSAFDSPFGLSAIDLVDSATAAAANTGASLSDEQYTRTIVATHIRLPQARALGLLRITLARRDTSVRWPAFDEPGQRVLLRTADSVVLEIERQRVPRGPHPFPVAATPATREFLEANAYVQSDQPEVQALARRIIGAETDAWRASLALERWVADSMHFDLGVAFAPSVEVYEHRRGTCVAYATLLATLARSVGIPSRVAFGYGYVNGMFGGHAWTEVLIGDRWLGIDGALDPHGTVDAARFAFAHGSLAGGPAELTSSVGAQLYGRIDASILRYRVEGAPAVSLSRGQPPYAIHGDLYTNPTLGFSLRKPHDGTFILLNATWPAMTVAGIAFPSGDTVRVSSVYREPPEDDTDGPGGRTSLVLPNGIEHYVLEATGRHAREKLLEVTRGFGLRAKHGN